MDYDGLLWLFGTPSVDWVTTEKCNPRWGPIVPHRRAGPGRFLALGCLGYRAFIKWSMNYKASVWFFTSEMSDFSFPQLTGISSADYWPICVALILQAAALKLIHTYLMCTVRLWGAHTYTTLSFQAGWTVTRGKTRQQSTCIDNIYLTMSERPNFLIKANLTSGFKGRVESVRSCKVRLHLKWIMGDLL